MTETLSTLIQAVMYDLGQTETFVATGGSATTAANSLWGSLDNQPEEDQYKNNYLFVSRDAGGAGASPEGKYGIISALDTSTWTLTFATLTDAVASGDTCMVVNVSVFPLMDIIKAVNQGLKNLGFIKTEDTSLTTASSQTEYTIPAALRYRPLVSVEMATNADSDDNQYQFVDGFKQLTSTLFYIPQQDSGYTLKLTGFGLHGDLNAYSDTLSVYVPQPLAVAAAEVALLKDYLNRAGDNAAKSWRAMYDEANRNVQMYKQTLDIWRPPYRRNVVRFGSDSPSIITRYGKIT